MLFCVQEGFLKRCTMVISALNKVEELMSRIVHAYTRSVRIEWEIHFLLCGALPSLTALRTGPPLTRQGGCRQPAVTLANL